MFDPSHFSKVNVNTAFALLNHDTATSIIYYMAKGKLAKEAGTIAWFCATLFKWFSLITARHPKLRLSQKNAAIYQETFKFLMDFIDIVCNLIINNQWKPFQTGLLLYSRRHWTFRGNTCIRMTSIFLLGRLTEDAREFKTALRLITLSLYESQSVHGNYFKGNNAHIMTYCKNIISEAIIEEEGSDEFVALIPQLI